MASEIRAEIRKLKGESNTTVTGLKTIKTEALKTSKDTNAEIKQRKAAIEGVISKIKDDLDTKNATRSESIRALADQIRTNAEAMRQVRNAARDQSTGKKGTEKKAVSENTRRLTDSIRKENETLRVAARKIRDEVRKDKETVANKTDTIREAAGMKKGSYSEEDIQKLGFSDLEEAKILMESKDIFDPRVILNVQNHA
jgi:hypothetical protein